MSAGDARPASGVLLAGGAAAPLAIEAASADPQAISPNGDGQADTALLTYRLNASANVTVEVVDPLGGVLSTVVDRVWTRAGEHRVVVDGVSLADGGYSIVVTARTTSGEIAQRLVPLTVSRMLGVVAVSPVVFSPNADGRRDRFTLTFALTAPADVRVRIERDGRRVASPFFGSLLPGSQRFVWDGVRSSGVLRDGTYAAIVEAEGDAGAISYGVPFVSDTVAPRVRILPGLRLRIEVSEPAMLTLRVDGRALKHDVKRVGVVRIPWNGVARHVRVVAWDAAGNKSSPAVRSNRTKLP